ncbi:high affinity immunoglobulin gamma Fc receptor I-like [Syngnathoides biaculeatus]|uniref:high affinity immunoglobulin gamma Fc receptor I-like n=1 Tax=Syngnathoides biaculeatus TaxID=300417 RepID=UPI002ADE3940|nr:high affinity immunoglobulin gamma Fc receptor I-like [Syngnathoides biaculeatus]
MMGSIFILVLSMLPSLVFPDETSCAAIAELVMGYSRVFSGEQVQLRCAIHDKKSTWDYLWFKGSEHLQHHTEVLTLKGSLSDSGLFRCQGVRNSAVGNIYTLKSPPVEINVDGGWAILQAPGLPGLVGETLNMTCRLRGRPRHHEVILYKDGVEVVRQRGLNPQLSLPDLSREDEGLYTCRVSWDTFRQTYSVISNDLPVNVSEVLTQPVLEISPDNSLLPLNLMKLICHLQYNARAPAPPLNYYFYKDNRRLGLSTSENYNLVKRTPGLYSCKVKVPTLGLSKSSEAEQFEE